MSALRKLAELGSAPIRRSRPEVQSLESAFGSTAAGFVRPLLDLKNGFCAFEGALHVYSDGGAPGERGLVEWNADGLWKSEYQGMAKGLLCFAEDVFGMQFCLKDGGISRFDPETGEAETMAPDLENWAEMILRDYEFWTGYRLAREWQEEHGPIPKGMRLVPSTPFVLGGGFTTKNLHALEAVKGMCYRASIAVQIRDLPDGASVNLRIIE